MAEECVDADSAAPDRIDAVLSSLEQTPFTIQALASAIERSGTRRCRARPWMVRRYLARMIAEGRVELVDGPRELYRAVRGWSPNPAPEMQLVAAALRLRPGPYTVEAISAAAGEALGGIPASKIFPRILLYELLRQRLIRNAPEAVAELYALAEEQ